MDSSARHLALLTRTIEVVNSSLDPQEVMEATLRGGTHGSPTSPLLHRGDLADRSGPPGRPSRPPAMSRVAPPSSSP